MLIVTAKLPRRKLAFGAAAAALLCCAALVLNLVPANIPSSRGIRTNTDRVAYLNGCGWQVTEEPLAVEEIRIPEEMDESYRRYLELQAAQGFDLERYAGRRIRRYTYEVTNYPTGESGVQANLMLYRTTVVGGEVLSPRMDGFVHGLIDRSSDAQSTS